MSEKLCTLRTKGGGGGKYTETSLWTNSAPTSSFADTTITLSQSIDNFKYICIRTRYGTTTTDPTSDNIYPVEDLRKSVTTAINHVNSALGVRSSDGVMRARLVFYVSDTSLRINNNYRLNTAETANNVNIPIEILGLNELATGHRLRETILWTNSAPTSSFSGQTVTLSEDLSNYDMVRLYWRKTTSDSSEMYIDVSISDYTSITSTTGSFQLYIGYRHTNGGCGRTVSGSGTTASFGNCYFFSSTTAANNANAIPTKVAGLRIS